MTERMRIEGVKYDPKFGEIYHATVGTDNNQDQNAEILDNADPAKRAIIDEFIARYAVPSEAEDALRDWAEERRLDDRDF